MTGQLDLIPDVPRLTARQQAAYDLIASRQGVDAGQIGANWHHIRGKHRADARCDYCETDGRDVVRSQALRDLVTYRRTPDGNQYILRGAAPASAPETGYDPSTAPIPF